MLPRSIVNLAALSSLILLTACGRPAAELRFSPQQRAGLHAIEMNKPAQDFFEGAVLGNGGMGVIICTRPDSVMIHLGHNGVWDIRVAENNREKLLTFDELWNRLKRGTSEDKPWFDDYCKMARENYAQPYPRPWPCGSVLLAFDRRKAELLGHCLRIDTGTCEVRFLLDGRPARLILFNEMNADRLWMRMVDDLDKPILAPFDRVRLIPEKGMATETTSGTDTLSFRQVLPVLGDDRDRDEALRVAVRVNGRIGTPLVQDAPFVACVQLEHGTARSLSKPDAKVPEPSDDAFAAASAQAARVWKDYWSRSGVQLDDVFLEQTWYRNMYFLNCAVRPGEVCPGLFANWSCKNIGTAWHGDYHTNYNLQQPFWVTFSSNRVDKHLPYVDLVHFLLPVSRDWAKNHYKLPGAFFPHSAYPVEMTMMPYPVPTWGAEVCETPWVVQSLWWHYLYTMDKEFLRDRAFEPIREAVQFLNAYMRRPEAHGPQWNDDKYHIYPTVVPELHGLRADPAFCADCIVDLTLTRFVFKAFLQACTILGHDREEASLMRDVRDILDHFPDYTTAQSWRGRVFVSVSGESPEQVYNTPNPLMPVFPGEDIGLHSPKEVLDIALNTWRNQRNEGGNELVFLNLQGARLGVLDLEKFKRQINYCLLPNGTCTDMVLQVGGRYSDETDYAFMARMGIWFENVSLPVVVNECLLQSYTGQLRFFPNWPRDKDAVFQDLRAVGAFLVSAAMKGSAVSWIRIRAEVGGPLRIINPWPGEVQVIRGNSSQRMSGELLELETEAGETLVLRRHR
ncbi:MAG: glycosyl hydrolase family 95 catalytic domain-containing protein [Phycisphaerae bacterium]